MSSAGSGNIPITPGFDFLGWDNTVNSTLEIRHDTPGENIIFGTSNLERMRIKPDARISINTTSSLGGNRFTVLQNVPSSIAVTASVGFFDPINPDPFAVGLFSQVGSATNRNTAIFGECDGLSKQQDQALQGICSTGFICFAA
ncbi:hypothetical protein O3Q51_14880 [Cryomorphaceae bacterium 1068]|nr:hypothetical protein [Cryomorphaceae bacterium 1068]